MKLVNDLWLHNGLEMIVEHMMDYHGQSFVNRRIRFGCEHPYDEQGVFVSEWMPVHGVGVVFSYDMHPDARALFPDDFIKIGDV